MSSTRIQEVLRFWFGSMPGREFPLRHRLATLGCIPYWHGHYYGRVLPVDARMRRLFGHDVDTVAAGGHADWAQTEAGRLALLLLCDQFPRNMHRGTPRAFALDAQGYALARQCLDKREDELFHPVVRSFYYLPLVHVEDLAVQNEAVELYRKLPGLARDGLSRWLLGMDLMGASRHRDIVQRFGRFPHRNRILNRTSTPEELRFLKEPFSSF